MVEDELLEKSKEAALAAVQIFNNPCITFKAESYVVLMIISWTYLLHAYFRSKKIDYRYSKKKDNKTIYSKTKNGSYKYWELERCLNEDECPLEHDTKNNLRFLIGLRHEIEHQMTNRIDDLLSARFHACCLNYNRDITNIFGDEHALENHLSFSLQFTTIDSDQKKILEDYGDLPSNIKSFVKKFDGKLTEDEVNSPQFAYRVYFVQKLVNHENQADRVIEFVKSDDPRAKELCKERVVIKESEKNKYLPNQIVEMMKQEGFSAFTMHSHTLLWKEKDAKNPNNGYGVMVAEKHWHWYEKWVDFVREHCKKNKDKYTEQRPLDLVID